jgi:hypothetical protein
LAPGGDAASDIKSNSCLGRHRAVYAMTVHQTKRSRKWDFIPLARGGDSAVCEATRRVSMGSSLRRTKRGFCSAAPTLTRWQMGRSRYPRSM